MTLSKGSIALIRIAGVLGIFVAIRIAAAAFEADHEHAKIPVPRFGVVLTPGQTLAAAGICLILAMACVIFGSLMDDDPDG